MEIQSLGLQGGWETTIWAKKLESDTEIKLHAGVLLVVLPRRQMWVQYPARLARRLARRHSGHKWGTNVPLCIGKLRLLDLQNVYDCSMEKSKLRLTSPRLTNARPRESEHMLANSLGKVKVMLIELSGER